MSAEWPADEANPASMPAIVSSTDLFDGELFGDELIDIYNSSINAESSPDALLPPASAAVAAAAKKDDADGMLAPIGDGFGTFRPSTSFNDLTNLLASDAAAAAPEAKKAATKKRPAAAPAAPAAKRKAIVAAGRRVSMPKKDVPKKPAAPKKAAPAVKVSNKNTPDPLVLAAARAAAAKTVVVAPKAAAVAALAAPAAATKAADPADFDSIAHAAVSSLMLSAGATADSSSKEKVDTSTAHIKALTGNNWVAACAGASSGVVPVAPAAAAASVDPKNANNNRSRRQNLTPDERARQNRDRNREHARNTRLRKKAYVEELKRTLTELVGQRDAAELEKRQAAQRELEQREVRFRVIEEFLKLRGRNEANFARWAAILEDGFNLVLPSTDFCKIAQGHPLPASRTVLNGVSDVMADASNFSKFLQTLGGSSVGPVSCQFQCNRKVFFMDGCQAVLEWSATTVGAVKNGACSELTFKGIVRGKFSPASNKLLSADITCDTGAVLLQLQKIAAAAPAKNIASSDAISFEEVAAAQAAASQADAFLDLLSLPAQVPSAVIVDSSSSSEGSCDKGGLDSDESDAEAGDKASAKNGSLLSGAKSLST